MRRTSPWAMVCCLILLNGCWSGGCSREAPTYPTTGKVVFKDDGKPLTGGWSIWFESTTPPYTRSNDKLSAEGTFELGTVRAGSGAISGEHRVRLEPEVTPADVSADRAEVLKHRGVHPKYASFTTTDLKVTIDEKPANQVVIEIERP